MTGTNLPRVPEGLRDLMKVFTKDVLREKPDNLYEYSANYFDGIVSEKIPQPMRKYEPAQNYETILKNRIRQQVPLSLVFNIIPETLTELIKQFIKAVLKENPENIYIFAKEYFHQLSISKTTQKKYTNYTTYEKYLEGKENVRYAPKVTCECGRVLSASTQEVSLNGQNGKTNGLILDKDNGNERSHNANYIRAVCIIQRNVRQYLKRKKANKTYNSHEYINAIYIIQRQFRRYLAKKRIVKTKYIEKQTSKNINQHYDSATYMRAVYVIQRHYRLYRKRQQRQKRLKSDSVSLSAAAFIIQRTFRRLIRARRAKKHTPAALDQGDESNDNASEAGSYTSASTALLSTESAGEHIEFGGNYEESVHQQTIKEDEEVENNYVNFDEKHFEEPIKTEGQSINVKMWDSSIEYTGNDDDVKNTRANIENEDIELEKNLEKFDHSDIAPNKKINSENELKTKSILSGKDVYDLKTERSVNVQEPESSENDLLATSIESINNLNNKQSTEDKAKHLSESFSEQDLQKTQDLKEKNNEISRQVEGSLDNKGSTDDPKKELQRLESAQKSEENNNNDKKEIIEPTIVKIDVKANESANAKPENEDQKQENKVAESVEEILDKAEISEKPLEKEIEIEETIANIPKKSENNKNQLAIEKMENDDKKNDIEVEGEVRETERSENTNDDEMESEKTINKVEESADNNNQSIIKEMHNKSEKKENEVATSDEEIIKNVEKSEGKDDQTTIEESEQKVDESSSMELPEEIHDTKITKREIGGVESTVSEEKEPITKLEREKIETTSDEPENRKIENGTNKQINAEKDITEISADKMEIDSDAPTNDIVKIKVDDPNIEKLENKTEITESTEVQPEILKIENEIKEQIIMEKDAEEMASQQIKIEFDGPSDDNIKNEIEEPNISKLETKDDRLESTEVKSEIKKRETEVGKSKSETEDDRLESTEVKSEIKKRETEVEMPAKADVEKKIEESEDLLIEPTIVKEEIHQNEATKVGQKNEASESTEVDNDESTAAKMENIVEEAILAKMAINKMSNKNENIEDKVDEILNIKNGATTAKMEMKVDEKPIEVVEKDDGESTDIQTEIEVASITKPKETSEPELVNEIIKQTTENIKGNDKDLTTEKVKNDSNELKPIKAENENIEINGDKKENKSDDESDEPSINKMENKSEEVQNKDDKSTAIVKIENNSNEPKNQENYVNTQKIEKVDSKDGEHDIETGEPIIMKVQRIDDAVTNDKAKGTDIKTTSLGSESESVEPLPIQRIKNTDNEEDIMELVNKDEKQATPIVEESDEIGKPNIIEQESNPHESIISKTESKEDDPTIELVADLINKLDIKQSHDEMDEPSIKNIKKNDANEPINEKIKNKMDEPEVIKLDDKNDQKISVRIENENDETRKDEPTVVESESNVNEPTHEPIIKKIEHNNDESSIGKLENNSEEQTYNGNKTSVEKLEDSQEKHEDKENKILKMKNKSDDSIIDKIKNEVKDIFGIKNESNSDDRTRDIEPILQSEEHKISSELSTERSDIVDGDNHKIDKRNADITESSAKSEETSPVKTTNESVVADAKDEKDSSLLKSNKLIGTQNFTNTTTNEIDSNTKKLTKEKHIGSSLESGRLIPTPIAELQLKSFKPPADAAPWYQPVAEYNISDENENKNENNTKIQVDETRSSEGNATEEIPNQIKSSNSTLERVPKYFTGDESTSIKDPKVKNSIAFFISFDSDDEKTTFKVPKKFLRNSKDRKEKQKTETKVTEIDNDDQLEKESYPEMEDELEIEIPENDFQQFAVSKLQTIQEVNESDSSNDFRYGSQTVEQDIEKSSKEAIGMVESNPTDLNQESIRNGDDLNNDNKRHNAAVIIQNCVRSFLKNKSANKITNDAVSKFRRNIAAKKIQKAYREFTKGKIQEKTSEKSLIEENKEESERIKDHLGTEMMAAIIIQKAFRSYCERKKLENHEESTQGSVTSSPMTAIRNLSISSELTSLESTSVQDVVMPSSEDCVSNQDIDDSVDGTTTIRLAEATIDAGIDTETIATARNAESTNGTPVDREHGLLLESKFVPDTSNSIIDQNQIKRSLEQDNAVISNDLAISTDDAVFGLVEDPTNFSFGHSASSIQGTAAIRKIVNEFLINEIQYAARDQNLYEVQEEPCIRKTASITSLCEGLNDGNKTPDTENKKNESSDGEVIERQLTPGESIDMDTLATDTLDKATLKLMKPEQTIEKMSQRQVSESLDKGGLPTEASFEEPIIKSMGSLQEQTNTDIEDGDLIIYNRLQREDTRESSAQSESVVFGETNDEEVESTGNSNKMDGENTRVQFTRHYTIAGDDPRRMFKSVTIDDTVRYMENGEADYDATPLLDATNSFCLDDETSETIRKKIMAYSFSETDSDYFDPNKVITDDSFIDTAMADDMGTSTETESTIVSAATKIQAGARGFLTRRRLRRASAGTKSSTQDTKASFGNDAISESLERFIEEEAAKKIQSAYRFHVRKQKRRQNKLEMSSLESSLAARRQKLQRGDALRNDSTPDDDNSARTSISTTNAGPQIEKLRKKHRSETAAEQRKAITSVEFKWPVLRQNSMPVQIDCEVLRVIPKHMRKRIKSAEGQKKKIIHKFK